MCHNAGILSQTPRKNFSLLVARVLLRNFITVKFILVSFVLLWLFQFFKWGGGVIAFALLSVHKSAVEPTVFASGFRNLITCLVFRVSKLPSIKQCQPKSDKRRYASPLRQHSGACMVSFPRRRRNKNAHFVHPSTQMRDTRCGMVKWRSSR